jgi:hypothetical protein
VVVTSSATSRRWKGHQLAHLPTFPPRVFPSATPKGCSYCGRPPWQVVRAGRKRPFSGRDAPLGIEFQLGGAGRDDGGVGVAMKHMEF